MVKKCITILAIQLLGVAAISQHLKVDSTRHRDTLPIDADINYDDLFRDLESFLDSISQPRSYFLAGISLGKGYFNFTSKSSILLDVAQKVTYSPILGYYHQSGFGFTTTSDIVNDGNKLNSYQYSLTPSFDYLKNRDLATGIAYTRFITKDSLPFYTTPLQNELNVYFTYRKWWVRPSVIMNYGWGSRSDYQQREALITSLRLRPRGYTRIRSTESISDFSMLISVRHDFYWLDVFKSNDHIRITPQMAFTSGTQKFGFNLSSNTYATTIRTNSNELYNSENIFLDDKLKFQPLSSTFYLRCEYSIGKFFIQPQLILDYYFPATEKNFSTGLSLNAGVMF